MRTRRPDRLPIVEVTASYEDLDALRAFADRSSPSSPSNSRTCRADAVQAHRGARARATVGRGALYRRNSAAREKAFLPSTAFPPCRSRGRTTLEELRDGVTRIGTPAVIKSAAFGYDGKGQHKITTRERGRAHLGAPSGSRKPWSRSSSRCRRRSRSSRRGPRRRRCRISAVREPPSQSHPRCDDGTCGGSAGRWRARAREIARAILEALDYVGVLCVEFFVTTDNELLVNELAPRPHNSGHLTFDAAVTSQFEQQVRAICGLPLGSTELLQPAAMANLLGDLWSDGEPNWAAACRYPDVKLHLYGKNEPRPGRKMGHLTAIARTVAEAQDVVVAARDALLS